MPSKKLMMTQLETPVEVDVNGDGNLELTEALERMPVVAILTGLPPARAAEVGRALVEAGVNIIEVPLRGQAEALVLKSIAALVAAVGDRALVGAGTVLTVEQVANVAATGAKLIVSPNLDAAVIQATKEAGLLSLPGVYTPTEALLAIDAGAEAEWQDGAVAGSPRLALGRLRRRASAKGRSPALVRAPSGLCFGATCPATPLTTPWFSAGADALKLFPTDGSHPKMLKAMLAVAPISQTYTSISSTG